MGSSAAGIRKEIRALADKRIAEHSQRFFRTAKGEYGEGEKFLGIRVPVIRAQVRRHRDASMKALIVLLKSPWHEERLFAVLALADRFKRGDAASRRETFTAYVEHRRYVNNWDLVDGSSHIIIGGWLENRSRRLLYKLARSQVLWDRRIAIMSTYHFIKNEDFDDTLALAEILLNDEHDLIHKATGWMLREVGNRDRPTEDGFLNEHYRKMPRTMLRYAIEKYPERTRRAYLKGTV